MASRFSSALSVAVLLSVVPGLASPTAVTTRVASDARCEGRYADSLAAMNPAAREREAHAKAPYLFCLRSTGVYEQISYGRGGRVRHQYHLKVRHGTGFAYRAADGRVLIATNEHVVAFPEVTGPGDELEGVPEGSRRVREEVRIVKSEAEADDPSQPVLTRELVVPALDLALLSSSRPVPVMPYAFGRSKDLLVGDAVLVRGFPLGAFAAVNTGSVIGVGQHDTERGWDHEDFAVDALLNQGSSGSPVLAVSCETGELELVGIYHAGYRGAQGLNVVVALDGIRQPMLSVLAPQGPPKLKTTEDHELAARAALEAGRLVFPFGGRVFFAERAGEAVRFGLLDADYPLSSRTEIEVLDRGTSPRSGPAKELREALWRELGLVVAWRNAESVGEPDGAARQRIERRLKDDEEANADLVAALQAGADGLLPVREGAVSSASSGPSVSSRAPKLVVLDGSRPGANQ